MNSRSDSRLRYFAGGSAWVVSGFASTAAHADRSARRVTVRATCSRAPSAVPPGRMKEFSGARRSFSSSHQLETVDVLVGDPQRRVLRFGLHRGGEVGAGVEQVVLDLPQDRPDLLGRVAQCHRDPPDRSVRLVAVGIGDQPRIVLRHTGEIAESGGPVVAGPGIDLGEVYGHSVTVPASGVGIPGSRLCSVSERFLVTGGNRLVGEVSVGGAKNSVLKLMAAALLAEGTTTVTNCPDILDVPLMADVLRGLGCEVDLDDSIVRITTPAEPKHHADFAAVRQFRASVCVLGPLVARCRRAVVALPGGDAIGSRPLDMHQSGGLRLLGAHSTIEHGCVVAQADDLHGANIRLAFPPSVGATENILMAAVLAKGETVIDNAAREPEIVDLCNMLIQMGAKIRGGAGTSTLTIQASPNSSRPRTGSSGGIGSSQRRGGGLPRR